MMHEETVRREIDLALSDPGSRARRGVRRFARRVVQCLLVVGMLLLSPGGQQLAHAQVQPGAEGVARALAQLDRFMSDLEGVRATLDPHTFDVDELSFELAFEDAETIVAWVGDNIAFEPYVGLLRGPQGTLLSRAGNALDQAVLLARLLADAGYEVRVAASELTSEQATDLLARTGRAELTPLESDPGAADALISGLGGDPEAFAAAGADIQARFDRLVTSATERSTDLIALLETSGAGLSAPAPGPLLQETLNYYWVQFRFADTEPWSEAHPAFGGLAPNWSTDLDIVDVLEGGVPAELQHRFRFQVLVEQRLGDTLEAKPIMGAWERPVANMIGLALTYATVPDSLSTIEVGDFDAERLLREAGFFVPMFDDALAPGGQLFDLAGNVVPPDAAASPAAGVFQEVGGAFGEATGGLTGEDDTVALTAQWLEYTLIAPGGEETTFRRTVFDRIGVENRAQGIIELLDEVGEEEVLAGLQQVYTIMLAPGRYPQAYVTDRAIEAALSSNAYLASLLEGTVAATESPSPPPAEMVAASKPMQHLRLFNAFDGLALAGDTVSYRAVPSLAVLEQTWTGDRVGVDIVHNARRSLDLTGELPVVHPETSLLLGVWETGVESAVVTADDEAIRFDTYRFFDALRADGIATLLLRPEEVSSAADLALPAASRAAIVRDLQRGYLVVVPERLPTDFELAAWWRVDPTTGETLGRGSDGRGQILTEEQALTLASGLITLFFGIAGSALCYGRSDPKDQACCLADGLTATTIGFGAGILLGFAGAAAAVSIGVGFAYDFTTFNLGFTDLLPTWCDSDAFSSNDHPPRCQIVAAQLGRALGAFAFVDRTPVALSVQLGG